MHPTGAMWGTTKPASSRRTRRGFLETLYTAAILCTRCFNALRWLVRIARGQLLRISPLGVPSVGTQTCPPTTRGRSPQSAALRTFPGYGWFNTSVL